MLYQRAGVVTEESPPISAPDDIDPKGDSSVPRHRMGRCCGAVRSAPKPGRPKLAQVSFRPNSLQAPPEQNWVALHGWSEEIHLPTCRDEPRLTSDPPSPGTSCTCQTRASSQPHTTNQGLWAQPLPLKTGCRKRRKTTVAPCSPRPQMTWYGINATSALCPGQADLTDPAWGAGRTLASPQATW